MIYFIKHTEFIKIGYTNNIQNRLTQLQISCPVKLSVIGLVSGSLDDEKMYHKKFSEYYSNGEWFKYNNTISEFIERLPKDLLWENGFLENEFTPIGQLKKMRINEGLSLEDLADKMGVTKQSIFDIETRELHGRITFNTIYKIVDKLGYKFQYRIIKL